MKVIILMTGAAAIALAPAFAAANSAPAAPQNSGHTNSRNAVGQPGADCEELVLSGEGATPGHSTDAPGSAFNPDGNAGKKYAGEQPQNSRNSASVSQYDSACRDTPRSPQ
jgi:hypothetical protein